MKRMWLAFFLMTVSMLNIGHCFADNHWLVSLGGGAQQAHLSRQMTVNNGLDWVAPFYNDIYSTRNNTQGLAMLGAAYRWQRQAVFMPAWSTGISWQHVFNTNVGGSIQQYSLPEFTNYYYQRSLSSNVAQVTAKLNIVQYGMFSPWMGAGIGVAFNHSSHYQEEALANVTSRISPNFGAHTTGQLAWNMGAGIDVTLSSRWFVSLGGHWQDLGAAASGVGQPLWSTQALQTHSYRAAQVLASVNYLF